MIDRGRIARRQQKRLIHAEAFRAARGEDEARK
jgi:hypothetical protein